MLSIRITRVGFLAILWVWLFFAWTAKAQQPCAAGSLISTSCSPSGPGDGCYPCYANRCINTDKATGDFCSSFCGDAAPTCDPGTIVVESQATCNFDPLYCPYDQPYQCSVTFYRTDECTNADCGEFTAQGICTAYPGLTAQNKENKRAKTVLAHVRARHARQRS